MRLDAPPLPALPPSSQRVPGGYSLSGMQDAYTGAQMNDFAEAHGIACGAAVERQMLARSAGLQIVGYGLNGSHSFPQPMLLLVHNLTGAKNPELFMPLVRESDALAAIEALTTERDAMTVKAKALGFAYVRRTLAMQAALLESREGSLLSSATWMFADLMRTDNLPSPHEQMPAGRVREWFDTKLAELDADEAAQPAPAGVTL